MTRLVYIFTWWKLVKICKKVFYRFCYVIYYVIPVEVAVEGLDTLVPILAPTTAHGVKLRGRSSRVKKSV